MYKICFKLYNNFIKLIEKFTKLVRKLLLGKFKMHAFKTLKNKLCAPSVLVHYHRDSLYQVHSDASLVGTILEEKDGKRGTTI